MKALKSLALSYDPKKMSPSGMKGLITLLDQQALPHEEVWIAIEGPAHMVECIKQLKVRGAPLIGVAAALCLGQIAENDFPLSRFMTAAENLRAARPTAVNLMSAIDRLLHFDSGQFIPQHIAEKAERIFSEDMKLCQQIADNGQKFVEHGDQILTHCNTGGLATTGVGTALGIIRKAAELNKKIHVFVDETRPLLQGGRLTTWELNKLGIPYTLICDNMAANLMAEGKITKAFVGADRIAMNGDFANKTGTYQVALSCYHHHIPFYVAAPYTTLDRECESGKDIPIEQRNPGEVRGLIAENGTVEWAPSNSPTYNPAFDVTPAKLVSAWVFDKGAWGQDSIKLGLRSL